jgi:hypothetical protein
MHATSTIGTYHGLSVSSTSITDIARICEYIFSTGKHSPSTLTPWAMDLVLAMVAESRLP